MTRKSKLGENSSLRNLKSYAKGHYYANRPTKVLTNSLKTEKFDFQKTPKNQLKRRKFSRSQVDHCKLSESKECRKKFTESLKHQSLETELLNSKNSKTQKNGFRAHSKASCTNFFKKSEPSATITNQSSKISIQNIQAVIKNSKKSFRNEPKSERQKPKNFLSGKSERKKTDKSHSMVIEAGGSIQEMGNKLLKKSGIKFRQIRDEAKKDRGGRRLALRSYYTGGYSAAGGPGKDLLGKRLGTRNGSKSSTSFKIGVNGTRKRNRV